MRDDNILESKIETYFKQQIKKINGITYKFKSTQRGVPDQLVAYNGQIYLTEIKRPGEKPRKSQIAVHNKFEKQNVKIYTLSTYDEVDTFITQTLKAEIPDNKSRNTTNTIFEIDYFSLKL